MRRLLSLLPAAGLLAGCAFVPGGDPGPGGEAGGDDDDGVISEVDAGVVSPLPPDAASPPDAPPPPPPPPPLLLVCRVDKAQVGTPGLAVRVGDSVSSPVVTFTSWRMDRREVVGFTLSSEAATMKYLVRAGDQELTGEGTTFELPRGPGGGGSIDRIDFCADD